MFKVAETEGAAAKLTEQLVQSEARIAKSEGMVDQQQRTIEDFKYQMSVLVDKLLERDTNVEKSFVNTEKGLNHYCIALNKAEDQVRLQFFATSNSILIPTHSSGQL